MADCTVCGNTLKAGEEEGGTCFTCRIGRLQEKVPVEARNSASAPPCRHRSLKPFILAAVAAACALGTALLLPGAFRAMRSTQPLRVGTYATDIGGDQCIANLWKAAAKLQAGGAAVEYVCPVSRAQYLVETSDDGTVVSCPNPEKHGLRSLSASSIAPVPLAVQ